IVCGDHDQGRVHRNSSPVQIQGATHPTAPTTSPATGTAPDPAAANVAAGITATAILEFFVCPSFKAGRYADALLFLCVAPKVTLLNLRTSSVRFQSTRPGNFSTIAWLPTRIFNVAGVFP